MTESDPVALAGLRRLVLHARELLTADPPRRPDNTFVHEGAGAAHVRRVAAHALAVEVLTLVADCLPAPAPAVDEALVDVALLLGLDDEHDVAELRREVMRLVMELADLRQARDGLTAERDRLQVALNVARAAGS